MLKENNDERGFSVQSLLRNKEQRQQYTHTHSKNIYQKE